MRILRQRVQTVLGYKLTFDAFYLLQHSWALDNVPGVKNEVICNFYLPGQEFSEIVKWC